MFAAGEDRNLELLTRGPSPNHLVPIYGQVLYLLGSSSTSSEACSGLKSYARSYYCTAKTTQELPIRAHIFQPSARTSGSFASGASPDHNSIDDYPEIRGSTCWNSVEEGRLIIMVAPAEEPSHNSSSKYPTIGRSEASDARTPSDRLVQNLNQDLNIMQLQTIMEMIQHMAPEG
jgi:hypothetical protein